MPINLNGEKYYYTNEACTLAGISKNTYLRWVSKGNVADVPFRDRRGWRLFTEKDLKTLKMEANRVEKNQTRTTG